MIFLKCKIRFIYVGFNCKRKKWGKKMSGKVVAVDFATLYVEMSELPSKLLFEAEDVFC